MKILGLKVIITGLAVVSFTQVSSANGFPTAPGLFLVDSATGNSAFVADVGGIASYNASVGDYTVAISTGQTVQRGSAPVLDLNVSSARTSTTGDSLQIYYSDGAFGTTTPGTYSLSTFLASGTVSTFAFSSPSVFGQTTPLNGGADVAGNNTVNSSGSINSSSYYLTIEDVITGNAANADTSLVVTPVPEPQNLTACGLLLLPAGMALRRYLRQRAS